MTKTQKALVTHDLCYPHFSVLPPPVPKTKIHPQAALLEFNRILCCIDLLISGNGKHHHPILTYRMMALGIFLKESNEEFQKALFLYFWDRFPHWSCMREFSHENLRIFFQRLSGHALQEFGRPGLSITPPKFKTVVVHASAGRTAKVPRNGKSCLVHPDKHATAKSRIREGFCASCVSTFAWGIRKEEISKKLPTRK